MLVMTTIQSGNPVLFLVKLKAGDPSFQIRHLQNAQKKTGRGKPLPVELPS
jgi:hypothetical protein